jgi:hypothetical protein
MDLSVFEGLPECLERRTSKLGEFVEEQNAVVGETDLPRSRHFATADQTRFTHRMMWGAKGSGNDDPSVRIDQTCNAMNRGNIEGFVEL